MLYPISNPFDLPSTSRKRWRPAVQETLVDVPMQVPRAIIWEQPRWPCKISYLWWTAPSIDNLEPWKGLQASSRSFQLWHRCTHALKLVGLSNKTQYEADVEIPHGISFDADLGMSRALTMSAVRSEPEQSSSKSSHKEMGVGTSTGSRKYQYQRR